MSKKKNRSLPKPRKMRLSISALVMLAQWATMTPLHGNINPHLSYGPSPEKFQKDIVITHDNPPTSFTNLAALSFPKIIYGEDDRHEASQYPDRLFRDKAKSVAGMVPSHKLIDDLSRPGMKTFYKRTAQRRYNLCAEERFAEQNVLPICSGVLIAPNVILTAGHCVTSQEECERVSWVFDYTLGTEKIPEENFYNCKKLMASKNRDTFFSLKDYALVLLNRPVKNREPVEWRKKGRPNYGKEMAIIGHPLGLPQKVTDNAEVKIGHIRGAVTPIRSFIRKRDFFILNADTYMGNSGSPVFNKETGLLEGLLIEGGEDFVIDPDFLCKRSRVKSDSAFTAEEKVFRANRIKELDELPSLIEKFETDKEPAED